VPLDIHADPDEAFVAAVAVEHQVESLIDFGQAR
jgi:hypothetical protein